MNISRTPEPDDLAVLTKYLKDRSSLSPEGINALRGIWKKASFKRRVMLTSAGQQERYLYFVLEGVQRIYTLDTAEREATLILTYPYSFGGVLDSFLLGASSKYYYETLTPSHCLVTTRKELSSLALIHPEISDFLLQGVAAAMSGILDRMAELQTFSATEKVAALLQRSPQVLRLIPHKYLANYLGIEPAHFSKIINTVRIP